MICEATYDNLEAIPETLRDEFESVNGKWQLKTSAIPGVGPLFNAGLVANRDRALEQLTAKKTALDTANGTIETLKQQLDAVKDPQGVVLSKEDAKLFEEYSKLGSIKDVKKMATEYEELSKKTKSYELSAVLAGLAKDTGLNSEVLSDWANSDAGKGLSFFTKEMTVVDDKGKQVTAKVPFVKVEKLVDGKVQVEEKELLPYAKETLPEWKVQALSTTASAQSTPVVEGHRLPSLKSAKQETIGEDKTERPVDRFNKQREAAPSPFAAKVAAPLVK